MRPSQKGRGARNKSGRKPAGNVVNRVYESAGPEGKVRGTPQQIIDKYLLLARDAQTAGDRVLSESFHQHAEHYVRLLNAAYQQNEERRRDGPPQTADVSGGFDDDFGDEQPQQHQHRNDQRGQDQRGQHREHDGGGGEQPRREERAAGGGLETIDAGESGDGGPVETPESAAAARPAPETGGEPAPSEQGAQAEPAAASEAADGDEKPKKRSANGRRRRKAPSTEEPSAESAPASTDSDEAHAG